MRGIICSLHCRSVPVAAATKARGYARLVELITRKLAKHEGHLATSINTSLVNVQCCTQNIHCDKKHVQVVMQWLRVACRCCEIKISKSWPGGSPYAAGSVKTGCLFLWPSRQHWRDCQDLEFQWNFIWACEVWCCLQASSLQPRADLR